MESTDSRGAKGRWLRGRRGGPLGGGAANYRNNCFSTKNRPIRQQNVTYLGQISDR